MTEAMTEEEREVWEEDMANDAYMGSLDPEPTCETCRYCVPFVPWVPQKKRRYCCIWPVMANEQGEVEEVDPQDGCTDWEWEKSE